MRDVLNPRCRWRQHLSRSVTFRACLAADLPVPLHRRQMFSAAYGVLWGTASISSFLACFGSWFFMSSFLLMLPSISTIYSGKAMFLGTIRQQAAASHGSTTSWLPDTEMSPHERWLHDGRVILRFWLSSRQTCCASFAKSGLSPGYIFLLQVRRDFDLPSQRRMDAAVRMGSITA